MLTIGEELHGRYKIEALLGEGGMGAVYRASDWLEDGRLCAVKEFRLGNLPSKAELDTVVQDGTQIHPTSARLSREQALEQFRREAKLLKQLDHPNLPKVFDYFTLGSEAYIVMSLIEGRDLVDIIAQNGGTPLPEERIRSILAQILSALQYCHDRHVIHRDIKPDNIILSTDDKVYLVDFGIAKETTVSTNTTTIAARAQSPGYAPPEQGGLSRTDERSDIYSLGATIYSLCTGQTPITALDRSSGIPLPSISSINLEISPELRLVVERCMKLDRNERFQTIEDILQEVSAKPELNDNERRSDLAATQIQAPPSKELRPDQSVSEKKQVKNQWFPLGARVWVGLGSTLFLALMTVIFIIKPFSGASIRATLTLQTSSLAVTQQVSSTFPAIDITETPAPSPTLEVSPTLQILPSANFSFTSTHSPTSPPASATPENTQSSMVIIPENISSLVIEGVPWQFSAINDLAFSPNGQTLAISSYDSIMLYKGSKYDRVNIPAFSSQVAFSPDGKTLITYEGSHIKFRDVETLELTNSCKIDPAEIKKLVVFPDKDWVAATGIFGDPYIAICTYTSSSPIKYLVGVNTFSSLAISPDGNILAAGMENSIYVWKDIEATRNNQTAEILKFSRFPISSLIFSPDGEQIISGGQSGELTTWSLVTSSMNLSKFYGYDIRDLEIVPGTSLIVSSTYAQVNSINLQNLGILASYNRGNEMGYYTSIDISSDAQLIAVGYKPEGAEAETDYYSKVFLLKLPTP